MTKVHQNAWVIVSALRRDPQAEIEARYGRFSGLDWNGILDAASQHGVVTLLLHALREYAEVPDTVIAHLRRMRIILAARNLVFFEALGRVLRDLEEDGIETILLKGAHLASTVYDDTSDRPMGDIDVLVHRQDLERIGRRLRDLGYCAHEHNADWLEQYRHLAFIHPKTCVNIQAHWNLDEESSLLDIDYPGVWQRSRQENVAGTSARVLCLRTC